MTEDRNSDVEQALNYMLFEQQEPTIIGITGNWGTGKTYFWKSYSEEKFADPTNRMAYVSLFGLDSISNLRKELRGALIPGTSSQGAKSFIKGIAESAKDFSLAGVSMPDEVIGEFILRRMLSNTHTVCLDDLERTTIPDNEVLGYANLLRDRFGVNVVLIYNEAKIDQTETYFKYREKVLDREIPFQGSPEHAVQIGISNEEMRPIALPICKHLEIDNIRIVRRADFFVNEVKSHLDEQTWKIAADHILHSLLLFCYLHFSPDDSRPKLDFLLKPDWFLGASDEEVENEAMKQHIKFLNDAGYQYTTESSRVLIQFVRDGILDRAKLDATLSDFRREAEARQIHENIQAAWELFSNTVKDNESDFVDALAAAVRADLTAVSAPDLARCIDIMDELNKEQADSILSDWIEAQRPNAEHWHGWSPSFPLSSTRVKEAIDELGASYKDTRTIPELLNLLIGADGWSQGDYERLNEFSVNDFETYFESFDGEPLARHMFGLLSLTNNLSNPQQVMIDVQEKAKETARRLSKKNRLNEIRFRQFIHSAGDETASEA